MTGSARERRRGHATVLAVILGVSVTACSGSDSDTSSAPMSADPGVVHVHGLGVDPADRSLYAATHSGLFRVPTDGDAERVADRYQDTMGFTVAGPGRFLGSGHPDLRENLPSRLGLIESTDRGKTWQALSLQGEVDFHALQYQHGKVYGYDATSSTFLVSTDGTSWTRGSQRQLRDFAVDPASSEVVLATSAQGLLRSRDGGRTFLPVPGAPRSLTVLAWADPDSLYAVGMDGSVQHSTDGGATWQLRGTSGGQPEALTVDRQGTRETVFVAVAYRGIIESRDGGRTFTTRYSEQQ